MSTIDQSRAYLALREQITAVRREFGEDTAWHVVEQAIVANLALTLKQEQICSKSSQLSHS